MSYRTNRPATALLALVPLLALSACGGGYGGSSTSGGAAGQVRSVVVAPSSASVAVNAAQQFSATARDANGNSVAGVAYTWKSSNSSIATVNSTGLATGVAPGTAKITATTVCANRYCQTVTSNAATLTVTNSGMVTGIAAMGHALAHAMVRLRDSGGQIQTAMTDSLGRYAMAADGLAPPFLVRVEDGRGRVLYGLGASVGVINVDPFTDAIARVWYRAHGTDPGTAFLKRKPSARGPGRSALMKLDNAFVRYLAPALRERGIDPDHFSIAATPFNADGTGMDAILDRTAISLGADRIIIRSPNRAALEVTVNSRPATVQFRQIGPLPYAGSRPGYTVILPTAP